MLLELTEETLRRPTFEVSIQNAQPFLIESDLEAGRELLATAERMPACLLLTANQVGMARRMIAFNDALRWDVAYNLFLLEKDGEARTIPVRCLSFPRKRVLLSVLPKVVVTFFSETERRHVEWKLEAGKDILIKGPYKDRETGATMEKWWDFGVASDNLLIGFQLACTLLDGVVPEVVEEDFRTVKGTARPSPNAPCPCGAKKPDGRPAKFKNHCGR